MAGFFVYVFIVKIEIKIKMKRVLFILVCCLISITLQAQFPFSAKNAQGLTLYYNIIDATKRYVELTYEQGPAGYNATYNFPGKHVVVPSTVHNSEDNQNYTVTRIGQSGFSYTEMASVTLPNTIKSLEESAFENAKMSSIYLPEGLETISSGAFYKVSGLKTVKIPSTVRYIGGTAFGGMQDLERVEGLKASHFGPYTFSLFTDCPKFNMDLYDVLKGLTEIPSQMFQNCFSLKSITIPKNITKIGTVAFRGCVGLESVIFESPTPPELERAEDTFQGSPDGNLWVPVETARVYGSVWWNYNRERIREHLTIGPSGYTTYYLYSENFKVPAGCTAYIITGINPSGNKITPDQAIVEAFTSGKILPQQTGFILQGTPNSHIAYHANASGMEENVSSNNLLVGTSVEQEFSETGYKYYVLANGDEGLGFYKQGTRNGASIKLAAHRAGLRLDESIGRAKSFIIDFEAAHKEAETTGIQTVKPTTPAKENIIYDLQGRRVTNPGRGIYIVNGKKVVRE